MYGLFFALGFLSCVTLLGKYFYESGYRAGQLSRAHLIRELARVNALAVEDEEDFLGVVQ